jgi:hypothetical protein
MSVYPFFSAETNPSVAVDLEPLGLEASGKISQESPQTLRVN